MGYVGKEVETIIRDLTDVAVKMTHQQATEKVKFRAEELAEERVLDALLPPARDAWGKAEQSEESSNTRQVFRKNYAKVSWTTKKLN